jgi:hypothetical protein
MVLPQGAQREFDMKLTRLVVSGKRLLLVIMS